MRDPDSEGGDLRDAGVYQRAALDPRAFWAEQARALSWFEPFDDVLTWDPPTVHWFGGGRLNVSFNCLDRHVEAGLGDRIAYYFEAEQGAPREITYAQLLAEVCRCANALRELGVERGDRVAIYLPTIPELPVAMLACSRIGAPHSVVPAGLGATELTERIDDAGARVLITAGGVCADGQAVRLKRETDLALSIGAGPVEHVLVVQQRGEERELSERTDGRDLDWAELVGRQSTHCPPEAMEADDLLFITYRASTTARPKPIGHTSGGYLTQVAYTHRVVFDLDSSRDVYWCTADIGGITGHGYVVYGPLANAATSILCEGAPNLVGPERWWATVERYEVTTLYASATAIGAFVQWGTGSTAAHDLTSLRVLGTFGDPITPDAWTWYHTNVGGSRGPLVDTWLQGETGAIMIAPLPGITTLRPGSVTFLLPGISVAVIDDEGRPVGHGTGRLVITRPWPAMPRQVYSGLELGARAYWGELGEIFATGERATIDEDGYFWLSGSTDCVAGLVASPAIKAPIQA